MKKVFALFLCLIMALTVIACGKDDAPKATEPESFVFSVGYGRVKVTPALGVSLKGYDKSEERLATAVLDDLYVSCVVIQDEQGNRAALIAADSIYTEEKVAQDAIRKLESQLGIPQEHVFFSSSHSHSTPAPGSDISTAAVEAATAAVADLKPATMYGGTTNTDRLNFVRHYIMNDESVVGDNYGSTKGKTDVGHVTDADPEMRLIRFVREGGKDIVMMNWQSHPHRTGGMTETNISADIVGTCRMAIEKTLKCDFIYLQGASGNLNPISRISKENVTADHWSHGNALAQAAISAIDDLTQLESGLIRASVKTYTGKVRKDDDTIQNAAADFMRVYEGGGTTEEAMKAAGGLVHSIYGARNVFKRLSLKDEESLPIYALAIGDVGLIGAPYEMFDTNAQYIRKESPFAMTFTVTYCNGSNGYIPSAVGFENGCYEMDSCNFVAGTGEVLALEFVNMLKELKTR